MRAAVVPDVPSVSDEGVDQLAEWLRGRRVASLTGAGMSTESGIPDYRGEGTRLRARSPVQYKAFVESSEARRRYWARAVVGWSRFASRRPNPAHQALAEMEGSTAVLAPITQNVDRLHQRAGSGSVIELHGALEEVICLGCRQLFPREEIQEALLARNPGFVHLSAEMAPDGDAEFEPRAVAALELVDCVRCGGVLKPHVVFFGEGVPRPRVEAAFDRVASADALLVLGTSLAVFSGYRFARRAHELGLPVVVVNVGPTRADAMAVFKLEARVGDVLPRLAKRL